MWHLLDLDICLINCTFTIRERITCLSRYFITAAVTHKDCSSVFFSQECWKQPLAIHDLPHATQMYTPTFTQCLTVSTVIKCCFCQMCVISLKQFWILTKAMINLNNTHMSEQINEYYIEYRIYMYIPLLSLYTCTTKL